MHLLSTSASIAAMAGFAAQPEPAIHRTVVLLRKSEKQKLEQLAATRNRRRPSHHVF